MAGIVLSLGLDTVDSFQEICNRFESLKELRQSHLFTGINCYISKYQRAIDHSDTNWFESQGHVVCAVGTVIYEGRHFNESVEAIGRSLERGASIDDALKSVDGHYCLFITEKKSGQCWIITDVVGAINIYFYKKGDTFFLSTSLLALASFFSVTPDQRSILAFIRSGMFFDDMTYFKEITALKPASIYRYDPAGDQIRRDEYWQPPRQVDYSIRLEQAAKSLEKPFKDIAQCIPMDETISDLTGGYDTRFIVSFLHSCNEKGKMNAFFFGPTASREARIVEENCRNLGIVYNNFVLPEEWPDFFFDHILESFRLSDGMINACDYAPVLWVQRRKSERFKNSVIGLLGEIYRGEMAKQEFIYAGLNRPTNLNRYVRYIDLSSSFDLEIFSPDSKLIVDAVPNFIMQEYRKTTGRLDPHANNILQNDLIYFSHRMRRWGGRFVMTTNQLLRPICPFLFRKPLSATFLIPHGVKRRAKLMRYIVSRVAPLVAEQKTITGSPFLMISIFNVHRFLPTVIYLSKIAIRKFAEVYLKLSIMSGFTTPDYDISAWYRRALEDNRCRELLDWEHMVTRGFYDKKCFKKFLNNASAEDFPYYSPLGRILTVELTMRSACLSENIPDQVRSIT